MISFTGGVPFLLLWPLEVQLPRVEDEHRSRLRSIEGRKQPRGHKVDGTKEFFMIKAFLLAAAAFASAAVPIQAQALSRQQEKGDAGARAVLQRWAGGLERHRFGQAWAQFGHPPASQQAFARWWSRYRTIKVTLGRGSGDAGAGSLYYTAQATLTGLTRLGKPYRLEGPVILRRVNDVDGATPRQLRWHIDSADLKAVPTGT
jgi:hypothetical protein